MPFNLDRFIAAQDRIVPREPCEFVGLPECQLSLAQALTSWDGKGTPRTAGEDIPAATRVMHVASTAVMFALHADAEEAVQEAFVRAWLGSVTYTTVSRGTAWPGNVFWPSW